MQSILCVSKTSEFWSAYSLGSQTVIPHFSGCLRTNNSINSENCMFYLTRESLIKQSLKSNRCKITPLRYKLLQPFYDNSRSSTSFGFSLDSRDFFVDSQASLDSWLNWLKQSCVNTTFEQEFVVIKEIGNGSSARVYLVENLQTRKNFAAKRFDKMELAKKNKSLMHLRQEIEALMEIDHPNVVKLHNIYETKEGVYLLMEYFPNGNMLKAIGCKESFNETDCLEFIRDLLETINYLHSKAIVHRDLKPENIMMISADSLKFKIIDFGLSYKSSEHQILRCGSPGYIAPEILREGFYNNKVDIFSAGVILYVLYTGNHPFIAKNSEKLLMRNAECRVKIEVEIKDIFKEFLLKMMSSDPLTRPEASELLDHSWLCGKKRSSVCTFVRTISTRRGSISIDV